MGGTPKSSIWIGFSIINQPFWESPIYGNPHTLNFVTWPHELVLDAESFNSEKNKKQQKSVPTRGSAK
jgi:hypothetical protein